MRPVFVKRCPPYRFHEGARCSRRDHRPILIGVDYLGPLEGIPVYSGPALTVGYFVPTLFPSDYLAQLQTCCVITRIVRTLPSGLRLMMNERREYLLLCD